MAKYILKRIGLAIVQIGIVATLVFIIMHAMPGDPAMLALGTGNNPDPVALELLRNKLGLNLPLAQQYFNWMKHLLSFNLGDSITGGFSVSDYLIQRLPRTLELAFVAVLFATILGAILGIIAALKRGSKTDAIITAITSVGISLPVFVMGTILILIFSLKMRLLPSGGFVNILEDPVKHLRCLALPALTISLNIAAPIARMTRSAMLDVLSRDFVKTQRAKGMSENKVIFKHVFRNVLVPIVTLVGLQFGNLIGGTVVVEYLFNYPGLSTMMVTAIGERDYPTIQGCILAISTAFILINLIVDLLYSVLDPRARINA